MPRPVARLTALFLLAASSALALPTDLDPSFGSGGIVLADVLSGSDIARDALLLPDGRIVVCGSAGNLSSFVLARFLPDGTPDPNFGGGGSVTIGFGGTSTEATGLAIQPDGKLVVAGSYISASNHFSAVARFDSSGVLDASFGTGGRVSQLIGAIGDVQDVALQPDGKIVILGSFRVTGSITFVGMRRYLDTGAIDTGFGASGTVTRGPGTDNHGYALAIQPDGKLVAVGTTDLGGGLGEEFLTFRFKNNGTPDSTFATVGRAITDVSAFREFAKAVTVLPDGRILTAGHIGVAANLTHKYAVARFLPSGALDANFGTGGIALTGEPGLTTGYAFLDDLLVLPGGKLLLCGQATGAGTSDDFCLARMDSSGAMDASFGSAGIALTDLSGGGRDTPYKVLRQPDGRLIEAGSAGASLFPNGAKLALARFEGDPATAGVGPALEAVTRVSLAPAFPNPSRGEVTLRYTLPEAARVTLRVFDAQGRAVATLCDQARGGGAHLARWDDANAARPGAYFARLEARDARGRSLGSATTRILRVR